MRRKEKQAIDTIMRMSTDYFIIILDRRLFCIRFKDFGRHA